MSFEALDSLIAAERALIAAIDADDVAAIEQRTADYQAALAAVKAVGAWRQEESIKVRAREALKLAEAARVRVNVLADITRQRLQLLAAARGNAARARVYDREGRVAL